MSSHPPQKHPNPNQRDWSHLPNNVLLTILSHLDSLIDLPRLRAVCPTWRTSLNPTQIPKLPSSFNISSFKLPKYNKQTLLLLEAHFYLLSPSTSSSSRHPLHGKWVARMGPIGEKRFHLFNPLNFRDYFISTPPLVGEINLLDCKMLELCRPMCLVGGPRGEEPRPISQKVVGGLNLKSGYKFAVLVQFEGFTEEGGLIMWRARDKKWTKIYGTFDSAKDGGVRIADIGYFNGKFYAFSLAKWKVGVIDPEESEICMRFCIDSPVVLSEFVDMTFYFVVDGMKYSFGDAYFVVYDGRLYLCIVAARPVNSQKYFVFVYVMRNDGKKCVWERVRSLGDVIFFPGYDVSFALPKASENLPEWKAGSICLNMWPYPMSYDEMSRESGDKMPKGIECLEKMRYAEIWGIYRLFVMEGEDAKKGAVSFEELPMKVYTGLFFPPPGWVKWRCPSLGNAEVKLDGLKFSMRKLEAMGNAVQVTDGHIKAHILPVPDGDIKAAMKKMGIEGAIVLGNPFN